MENLVLVTVDLSVETTDAKYVAEAIGVPPDAIDVGFGVVLVDPSRHRCAVRVKYEEFSKRRDTQYLVSGPFSDPIVETF